MASNQSLETLIKQIMNLARQTGRGGNPVSAKGITALIRNATVSQGKEIVIAAKVAENTMGEPRVLKKLIDNIRDITTQTTVAKTGSKFAGVRNLSDLKATVQAVASGTAGGVGVGSSTAGITGTPPMGGGVIKGVASELDDAARLAAGGVDDAAAAAGGVKEIGRLDKIKGSFNKLKKPGGTELGWGLGIGLLYELLSGGMDVKGQAMDRDIAEAQAPTPEMMFRQAMMPAVQGEYQQNLAMLMQQMQGESGMPQAARGEELIGG